MATAGQASIALEDANRFVRPDSESIQQRRFRVYSYSLSSCKPDPICKSQTSTFYNLEKVWLNRSTYFGNATGYDWVVNSGEVIATDNGTKLTLNETNGGTKISSTRYIHYGKIDFVLETSKWAGVVTAAITMSDVKDEIDWEFPGNNTLAAQTNFWFLGIANYSATKGRSVGVSSATSSNFHTYTIDWQPETLTWLIDGSVVRTLYKNQTLSSNGTLYQYPTTPSQIQISIWPAGLNTSAQGTINWAGGLIDWQDSDYLSNGFFWNTLQSVTVTCADETNVTSGTTGWVYTGIGAGNVP
ncbi:glycosylase, partial [Saitozyma sp. JCM 24511]